MYHPKIKRLKSTKCIIYDLRTIIDAIDAKRYYLQKHHMVIHKKIILFNILRGCMYTWTFPLIAIGRKINKDKIIEIFNMRIIHKDYVVIIYL
jgi:hypothetical protein